MTYLIANWKASPDFAQVQAFVRDFPAALATRPVGDKQVIVAAPAIFYAWLQTSTPADYTLALEDISVFPGGAYTGEITAQNLRGLEPAYVIVGHSERRREFGETNETVIRKARSCWAIGATPIICFDTEELADLAARLSPLADQPAILAYEPVSSISTSGAAGNLDPEILRQQMADFRARLPGRAIVYGGSVKPDNAGLYGAICDGLLVGSASLQADSFAAIVHNF